MDVRSAASKAVATSRISQEVGRHLRSIRRIALAPASLAIAVAGAGCASSAGPTDEVLVKVETQTSPTIFGGARDDDGQSVAGVVALRIGMGQSFDLCTGALVAPNLVLTARHCVAQSSSKSVSCDENGRSAHGDQILTNRDPATIGVYVGSAPNFAKPPSHLARALVTPAGRTLCDADIALVVLEEPIVDVAPLAVRLTSPTQPGERIRSVGYGQNDGTVPIGTRFRKTGVSVLAQGRAISRSHTPLGAHEFEVGRSTCLGDSGGPAISETTGAVVGVVSRGGSCEDDFGHIYTTTAGFDALFAEAFQLAGATVLHEPGDGTSTRPTSTVPRDDVDEASTDAAACAAAPKGARTAGGAFGAALSLAAALLVRRRRRA